jgi:hypothetical protein
MPRLLSASALLLCVAVAGARPKGRATRSPYITLGTT